MEETTLDAIPRISWVDLRKNLESKTPFEALSPLATCLIRVREYSPFIANVSHSGHRVREELEMNMLIEEQERLCEEDVGVDRFLDAFPIQIIALDSRYEYDVNRPRKHAVYLKPFESWGKKVWRNPPRPEELEFSLEKYDDYHEIVEFVVESIQKMFGSTLVLDLHSYNYRRSAQSSVKTPFPTFDLVLSEEDKKEHQSTIDFLSTQLKTISTPEGPATVLENAVFQKDGAIAERLQAFFPDVLTLPIEIKKIYMEEKTGVFHEEVLESLRSSLNEIFPKVFSHFRKQTS